MKKYFSENILVAIIIILPFTLNSQNIKVSLYDSFQIKTAVVRTLTGKYDFYADGKKVYKVKKHNVIYFTAGKLTFRQVYSGKPFLITFSMIFGAYFLATEKSASGEKSNNENPIEGIPFKLPSMVAPIVPE